MAEPTFSVLLLTAAPPGQAAEAGGAYVKIDGREALLRSVELFLNRENIKQIQLCFLPDMEEDGRKKFGAHLGFSGVKVISGGPRWADQIAAGVQKLAPECTHVIVHDAARPAVPFSDIDALLEEAGKHPAVVLAAPSRNTLVEVDEGGNAMAFHLPALYMQALSPQVYAVATFKKMATSKQELHASQVSLLKGSALNVRIGGPGDATLVKTMIGMLPKPKSRAASNPFEEAQW